ncbi:hypothetical protein HMPREF0765_4332 [Sphingobacterium spiritivorum ATCC 33300]|uniref:Uncharacterized protein n=1 Tax=Sphingobacterium spiritivorum ATCC 33300 TaxID=525372 RepID=C2G426_SPHSI|nr:hypothetical protein [Sphingobacterium spiritivorum]EEI90072.1 hypothetical protein HMPREF0765_4332 [Sphingobacterium spiritivorum ATCC 33300]QQS95004.1 hypothetical protein I6J03_16720 [Sphingobacterium spiritivorum]
MLKKKDTKINLYLIISLVLLLILWLMMGVSQDDEFNEYSVFVKYRPTTQLYFKSPLGMDDMPPDFPEKLRTKKAIYDDFVLTKHWSDHEMINIIGGILILITPVFLLVGIYKQIKK